MKRRDSIAGILAIAVILAVAAVWVAPWQGRTAPEIELTRLDGGRLELASLRGQPVMLQFWATTCVTCVAEMPHLKALHRELAPEGFELIGVAMSYDPPGQVRRMVAEKQLPYTIALDSDGRVANAFGDVRLTPTSVLIAPNGEITWKRLGELDFEALEEQIRGMLAESGSSAG